ncbi:MULTISPECIES: mobile mystery protein B [unclassified Bradyrhizobium]|uniref:mobile mystery protein B n=1 Tax=unclassified Bradyrhizobium TaxID=2631580 RepID=UPI0029169382|nr:MULTISPECIES: mobile mystery protein B [unclassified Bradyrhizobium]
MTDLFQEPNDATPLDPALRGDLLQTWITSRADLNEAEEENIVKGAAWGRRRRGKAADLLTEDFVKTLHKQMFGEVWKWAGTYRQGELNIGIAPHLIAAEMPAMLDDVSYWVEHATYPPDEIAARLHHRLTQIHAFPNGNGRHARMMADLVIERLGGKAFSWGGGSLADVGTLRNQYVAALRAADNHDIGPLLAFMRS